MEILTITPTGFLRRCSLPAVTGCGLDEPAKLKFLRKNYSHVPALSGPEVIPLESMLVHLKEPSPGKVMAPADIAARSKSPIAKMLELACRERQQICLRPF